MTPRLTPSLYTVAYQSGQELAALFLLRTFITFIEQFARRQTGSTTLRGEDLMGKYMEPLPGELNTGFPSLRKLYEEISAALHEADPTKAPFQQKKREVDRHFDARRLLEVPDNVISTPQA